MSANARTGHGSDFSLSSVSKENATARDPHQANFRSVSRSPKKSTAKTATKTTRNLSTGATPRISEL